MARILVLGDHGLLGCALVRRFQRVFEHREVLGVGSAAFDAAVPGSIEPILRAAAPDVVVNAVAMLGLDRCEAEPDRAFAINTIFPHRLATLARAMDFRLVHFSSDAVFADTPEVPWFEDDRPRPSHLYGMTKLAADELIAASGARHTIFRIPTLFGPAPHPRDLLARMLQRAEETHHLRVAQDVFATPAYSLDVAEVVSDCLQTPGTVDGLFHVASPEVVSLHAWISTAVSLWGYSAQIEPVAHATFTSVARKNTRTPLASRRLPPLRPWPQALAAYCDLTQRSSDRECNPAVRD